MQANPATPLPHRNQGAGSKGSPLVGSRGKAPGLASPDSPPSRRGPQLAVELKNWTKRQQELKSLLDRADQSAGGSAVGLLAYRGDYVNAGEELQMLHTTAHNKNCEQDESWRSSAAIR